MSIPDTEIDQYMSTLLGHSSPGGALHHLLLVTAERDALRTPLGIIDPDSLKITMNAIAPVGGDQAEADQFITDSIVTSIGRVVTKGEVIHFAGLAMEFHHVMATSSSDHATIQRMQDKGQLHHHPDVVEATRLWAASHDGRRWVGTHYLTGPQAGTIEGPSLRWGTISADELGDRPRLIRRAVGLKR